MEFLEETETVYCTTKELCLSVMLGGVLFILSIFTFVLPISLTWVFLYVFRDYSNAIVKAFYVKFTMWIIFYLILLPELIMFWLLGMKIFTAMVLISAVKYYDFNFNTLVVWKLGIIEAFCMLVPTVLASELLVLVVSGGRGSFLVFFTYGGLLSIALLYYMLGVLFLFGTMSLLVFRRFESFMDDMNEKVCLVLG